MARPIIVSLRLDASDYEREIGAVTRDNRQFVQSARQINVAVTGDACLLYTSPSPRDRTRSRMPSSA